MREISVEELNENVINLIGKDWMLITAGNIDKYNTMTASWGSMGFLWGKPVVTIFIRPQRYTYGFVEKSDFFTLSFFAEKFRKALSLCGTKSGRDIDKAKEAGITPYAPTEDCVAFKEARLVLKCKKLYKSLLSENSFIDKSILPQWYKDGDLHYMYVAEIENIWEKINE
ncbi:MAG: flavin reductase family protein [Bacteroidales bacterium]|nr:flavin reductase family protein [Bacteroidales bacterium]MBR5533021.1 flavin reductase family protein [Bacteroidales bacterium]